MSQLIFKINFYWYIVDLQCWVSFCCIAKWISYQFSSVALSCPTLCNPMNHSTPGLPAHHQLPEFTETHVHWVGDAIQPSHPRHPLLLLPSIFPSISCTYTDSLYLFIYIFLFFPFIFISWRLITLQYYSGFCHTLTWISHGFTCIPHPNPPSCLPDHQPRLDAWDKCLGLVHWEDPEGSGREGWFSLKFFSCVSPYRVWSGVACTVQ